MKRSPIVLLSTVAGVAAVLALNPDGASLSSTVSASGSSSTSGSTTTGTGPSTSSTAAASSADTTSSSSTSSSSSSSTTTSSNGLKNGSATGTAYSARNYGEVQVKVTVKNGKITKVATVNMPGNDGRSQWISSQAGPMLVQQALSAQSANVNGVSGATFTSMAFAQSLQSALDQLKA